MLSDFLLSPLIDSASNSVFPFDCSTFAVAWLSDIHFCPYRFALCFAACVRCVSCFCVHINLPCVVPCALAAAMTIRSKCIKEQTSNAITSLGNLGSALSNVGQHQEAADKLRNALDGDIAVRWADRPVIRDCLCHWKAGYRNTFRFMCGPIWRMMQIGDKDHEYV